MKKIKIGILDDELHSVESLTLHLEELFPDFDIVYKSTKVQEAISKLPEIEIDLLFLDIEMPGMNGFQLLEQIQDRKFDVIFITAYSEYAIEAFKAKAINYLLKPIDEEELENAINKWLENYEDSSYSNKIESLIDYLKKEGMMKSKISVPVMDGFEFVEINDIVYCQSNNNYTQIYMRNGDKFIISRTLKGVEEILNAYFFIRVHQSYIINPNYLSKYSRSEGGYLVLLDDIRIPISNAKRSLIVSLFNSLGK
ncbi:MAG TPA: LytTR family DNA-binding domain-containing protein [Chitinophagaceae bacterium]|nr:LytTR family DNA-binding domain-containing protein [Chitinophagaceae bacterium]